jgi:hypothetical protein
MKISAFHLMPHRELPGDFEQKYESVWVTPPWHELAEPQRVGQYYNWTLDELLFAARAGFDGVCTNEHHQNAYGFMPSPNIMGAVLAKATNGSNVAIVQMGPPCPRRTRPSAWPRSTPCSIASAAGASWPASRWAAPWT